jgi:hypothetical protein
MPVEYISEPDGLPGWKLNRVCPDVFIQKALNIKESLVSTTHPGNPLCPKV